jgi:hypothetical protein
LAEAMFRVATMDHRHRRVLVQNGLNWVERNCAPENHAKAILAIWRNAVTGVCDERGKGSN